LTFNYCSSFFSLEYNDNVEFSYSSESVKNLQFDLSSLTKVLFTANIFFQLNANDGKLYNRKISKYVPEFEKSNLKDITILDLINHRSGLPAHKVFFKDFDAAENREIFIKACLKDWKREQVGKVVYSDYGYILLGYILEKIFQKSLNSIWNSYLKDIGFQGIVAFPSDWKNIAPTERGRHGDGRVNDDNCFYLKGVSGHCGLFASLKSLTQFVQLLYRQNPCYFERTKWSNQRFYQGWDSPRNTETSHAGSLFTQDCLGHLGYTGCSLWFSAQRQKACIILSNRVFPISSEENTREILLLRRKIQDQFWNNFK